MSIFHVCFNKKFRHTPCRRIIKIWLQEITSNFQILRQLKVYPNKKQTSTKTKVIWNYFLTFKLLSPSFFLQTKSWRCLHSLTTMTTIRQPTKISSYGQVQCANVHVQWFLHVPISQPLHINWPCCTENKQKGQWVSGTFLYFQFNCQDLSDRPQLANQQAQVRHIILLTTNCVRQF